MDDSEVIYFVTVFFLEPDKTSYKRIRCWGWFKNEADAESCIKENWTDIYEAGYYNFALIEPMRQGVCCIVHAKDRWFQVDQESTDSYKVMEVPKPERFRRSVGFSYA